jgi:hypothetical protein
MGGAIGMYETAAFRKTFIHAACDDKSRARSRQISASR